MLVRDWMTPNPMVIAPDTPVLEALKLLGAHHFRRLPIVKDGALIGMVTDKDLKDAMPSKATTLSVWELNYLLSKLTVSEVMASPVVTAFDHEFMEDAALRLQEHKIGGMPVLDKEGNLVGMITITDVLRAFTQIMGLQEGGERITIDVPDVPGSLNRAIEAIKPSNIISVATSGSQYQRRRFVIRVVGEASENVRDRLTDAGILVYD